MAEFRRFVIRNNDTKKFYLGEEENVWVEDIGKSFFFDSEDHAQTIQQLSADGGDEFFNFEVAEHFKEVRFDDLTIVPVTITINID